jgi:Flp pilus assembly protein CpaB
VRHDEWPEAVVPAGALVDSPVGQVATATLVPGEAVVAARVAPDGVRGPAALLAPGHRAVAVPTAPGTPPLAVGDRIDVVSVDGDPSVVATDAVVVDVGDHAVTVGVPPGDAPAAAAAAASGAVALTLIGP